MSHRILTGLGLSIVGLVMAAGCKSPAPTGPVMISLQYRATEVATSVQTPMKGTVSVIVTDQRDKKDTIGQNIKDPMPRPVYTRDDPAAFVRGVVVQQLQSRGAMIAPTGTPATRQVSLQLMNFYTTESNMYRTAVQFNAQVLGEDGQVLWKGLVSGANEKWGASYKAENYQESLSDATSDAVMSMLNDPGFVAAMK